MILQAARRPVAEGMALASRVFHRYPDRRVDARDVLSQGDKVMVRSVWIAHDATDGLLEEFHGFTLWRVSGGRIVERWATTTDMKPVEDAVVDW